MADISAICCRPATIAASTAPTSTWQFCIGAVPHSVPGTNAGRLSCQWWRSSTPPVCDDADAAARSGRLFLCRRCRSQAIVCSCCDRGQAYCGVECARQVRRQAQRAAAERYAESLRGRRCHADRSRRYRARQEIVTHQGSPPPPAGGEVAVGAMAISRDDAAPTGRAMTHCHWCGRPCLPQLRQGFLRRRDRRRSRVGHARMEHEPPW